MDTIRGIITKVLSTNEDTGRVFLAVEYETETGQIAQTKVGGFAREVAVGDAFVVEGEWRPSNYRGKSEEIFNGKQIRPDIPQTVSGIKSFLKVAFSPAEHGVSSDAVDLFVDRRGAACLKQATENPEILLEMCSDPKRFRNIILQVWRRKVNGQKAVSLMQAAGVESRAMDRILTAWQEQTYHMISANPYAAAEIPKVGFPNADILGTHMGISAVDSRRLVAAVNEVLRKQESEGSTFADLDCLLSNLGEVSGIDRQVLTSFLLNNLNRDAEDFAIYRIGGEAICAPVHLFHAEIDIANRIAQMVNDGQRHDAEFVKAHAAPLFKRPEFSRFDAVQRIAIYMAVSEPVSIITGGPGTGKSTVMEAVCELSEAIDKGPLLLAAPTADAAQRLAAATARPAQTVHAMLGAIHDPSTDITTYRRNSRSPLPGGCRVIIDEASMLDAELMSAILQALPSDGKLLIVGDPVQLPSVGPGTVLEDLLEATVADQTPLLPSVALIKVYRQEGDSGIAIGAAKIREGEVPTLGPENDKGVSFHEMASDRIAGEIEKLVCEILPEQGYDPLDDVAVLIPQAPGAGGSWEVNARLSARLNPDGLPIPGLYRSEDDDPTMPAPRLGDKVMVTENDKKLGLINGDRAFIIGSGKNQNGRNIIKLRLMNGREVEFPTSKWRKLILAYAGTIYKSQGNQFPVVVMGCIEAHTRMLDKKQVYTGWTRAKKRLFVLGQKEAFKTAVTRVNDESRKTLLRSFIRSLNINSTRKINWEALAKQAQRTLELVDGTTTAANQNAPLPPLAPGMGLGFRKPFGTSPSQPQSNIASGHNARETASKQSAPATPVTRPLTPFGAPPKLKPEVHGTISTASPVPSGEKPREETQKAALKPPLLRPFGGKVKLPVTPPPAATGPTVQDVPPPKVEEPQPSTVLPPRRTMFSPFAGFASRPAPANDDNEVESQGPTP
ncbi:AAA family ATPase [Thalassospira xiamenensis]|uniref:Exodeoxyribonuclease V alpha subunit n=1 Tax=Thalassospira xiamenensis TaxID=220697 RepID=A0A285TTQ0_9PROT|nr:AAA family ATPase [Thalassospira xiamenensis]SOC27477.1 exodeoxyribonuclease V alpha subunit [Thalassospira xiamenensis]